MKTDILIVGGGPAGMSAAYKAACVTKGEATITVVDKKPLDMIGDKPCGDAYAPLGRWFLEKEMPEFVPTSNEISDIITDVIVTADDVSLTVKADDQTGLGVTVDRHKYGQRLLKLVENKGVNVIDQANVIGPIITDKKVSGVTLRKNGKKMKLNARMTIDCSGRNAVVAKKAWIDGFTPVPYQAVTAAAFREIIKVPSHEWNNAIELIYDESIPFPGYFWIFSRGEDMLNVGIGWLKGEAPGKMREVYTAFIKKYFKDYEVIKSQGHTIPLCYPNPSAVAPGFLVAGDAGYHTNPVTAGGHATAMITGTLAGKVAGEIIVNKKEPNLINLWRYNVSVMDHIGKNHLRSFVVGKFLEAIGFHDFKRIIKKELIKGNEVVDMIQGRPVNFNLKRKLETVVKCIPHVGLFRRLAKLRKYVTTADSVISQYPVGPLGFNKWHENTLKNFIDRLHW